MIARLLSTLYIALLLSSAGAVDLPDQARITLVSENGVVLGFGTITGGNLTLTLQAGAEGSVRLLIVAADGTIVALDGIVTVEGQVLVTSQGTIEDLALSVRAAGGQVMVAFEQRTARSVEDVADQPEQAQDGIAGADTPGGNNAGGVGGAPDGNNGVGPDENPGKGADEDPGGGPNENAGDNPNENAGSGPGENSGGGPNENAGDNPNENAGGDDKP